MRILTIVQNYPPERGPVRYTELVVRGLAARGHTVTVVTQLPHYPTGHPYDGFGRWQPDTRIEDDVRVVRVPTLMASNRQPLRRMFSFLTFLFSALPYVGARPRPDVIIASVPPPTIALLGAMASFMHISPWVAILRDIEPIRSLHLRGMSDKLPGRVLIQLFAWLYQRAACLVVVHERERETLLELGIPNDRIAVIPHGIDIDGFDTLAQAAPSLMLPRRAGRSVALYLGTIGKVHDLAALVETAVGEHIRALPVDFVIVGDGQFRDECITTASNARADNITFLPPVDLDHVPSILKQADILICSHKKDAYALLGSKFYEYCAAGKPILVHGQSAAAQLVEEIGNGLACTPGDVDSLHAALSDFTSRPDFWREQGLRGRDFALEHFSQSERDTKWAALLSSIHPGSDPRSGLA